VPGKKQDLGRLRLTMAQFFRVDGDSTQHRGVVPDILFPTAKFSEDYGERSLDNALPWAHIAPANYQPAGKEPIPRLMQSHLDRITHDAGFEMLVDQEKRFSEMDQRTEVSLLESKRQAEFKKRENERLVHQNRFRTSQGMAALKLDQLMKDTADGEDTGEENKATHRIELNEAARILVDSIRLQEPMAVMR
jgi:carboxyl-terminal processing protease